MKIARLSILIALIALATGAVGAESDELKYKDAPESMKITCRSGHWKTTKSADRVMRKKMKLQGIEKSAEKSAKKSAAKLVKRLRRNKAGLVQLDNDPFSGVKLLSARGATCTDRGKGSKIFAGMAAVLGSLGDPNVANQAQIQAIYSEGSWLEAYRDIENAESVWVFRLVRGEWSAGEKSYTQARDLAGNEHPIQGLDKKVISSISTQIHGATRCYGRSCYSIASASSHENQTNVTSAGIIIPRELLKLAAAEGNRGFAFRLYGDGASKQDTFVLPSGYIRAFLSAVDDLDTHVVPQIVDSDNDTNK